MICLEPAEESFLPLHNCKKFEDKFLGFPVCSCRTTISVSTLPGIPPCLHLTVMLQAQESIELGGHPTPLSRICTNYICSTPFPYKVIFLSPEVYNFNICSLVGYNLNEDIRKEWILSKKAYNYPYVVFIYLFIYLFISFYLFIQERHTERGRDTGTGRNRLHAGSPTWDSIPGLQDQAQGSKAWVQPLSQAGVPFFFSKHYYYYF